MVLGTGLLVGAIWLILHNLPGRRRVRQHRAALKQWDADYALAQQWSWLRDRERTLFDHHIARVTSVYAVYPQKGTKAVITWLTPQIPTDWGKPHGQPLVAQDAWFRHLFPNPGQWILIKGDTGYGEHNNNPKVLYIQQIAGAASPQAPYAWQRCADRNWTPPELPR